ncbi:hypothetical protein PINS_up012879 [Pythium insidiosum]|nr:hypothetical protein PINS_up012879 [Pythium insidiosum]
MTPTGHDVVVRSSRSRSLTDRQQYLPPPTDSALAAVDEPPSEDAAPVMPRMRRAMSADVAPSLSLLQQELGYPRPRAVHGGSTSSSCAPRRRGSLSRRSHNASVISVVSTEADSSLCGLSEYCVEDDSRRDDGLDLEADGTASTWDGEYDDDDGENFLDDRIATVTGYARDTDDVVYYEIVVESVVHGPLSAYKVRRRYSEFRDLHRALAKIMPSRPWGTTQEDCDTSPPSATLRMSTVSLEEDEGDEELHRDRRSRSFCSEGHSPDTTKTWYLPSLPDSGGLWSFLQRGSSSFLRHRTKVFNAIILAAQQHPRARASRLLNRFLGPPPDACSMSYVSLNRFAAPRLRFSIEFQERKEVAKNISRKRRQLDVSN